MLSCVDVCVPVEKMREGRAACAARPAGIFSTASHPSAQLSDTLHTRIDAAHTFISKKHHGFDPAYKLRD